MSMSPPINAFVFRPGLVAAGMVLLGAGCIAGPRMAVPADLAAQSQELQVVQSLEGATDYRFSFGPYSVTNMVAKRTESGEGIKVDIMFVKSKDTTVGGYSYRFQAPGSDLRAECAWQQGEERRNLPLGSKQSSPIANMECKCQAGGLNGRARMGVDDKGKWTGKVDLHGTVYDLMPVKRYKMGGNSITPRGYAVQVPQGGSLAAIEVTGSPTVWLGNALDPQSKTELSCLLAGFLFYKAPENMDT